MINLLFLIFLFVANGYLISRLLLGRDSNKLLSLGLSFGFGIGWNSVLFFLFSAIGLKINLSVIVIYSLITLLVLVYLNRKELLIINYPLKLKELINRKYDLITLFLCFFIFSLLLAVFYRTLITVFGNADEWSYWGVAAKRVFQFGTVDLRHMGFEGFEKYPLLSPITAASFSMAINQFTENFSKLISPLSLSFITIFLYGYFKNIGLKTKENMIFLLMLLASGPILSSMSSNLYADIPFAYLYSAGVLIFTLVFINQKLNRTRIYLVSGIFLSLAAWTKIEGSFICLGTALVLWFFDYVYNKVKLKQVLYVLVPALVFPLFWYLYGKAVNLGQAGWTDKVFDNTRFAIQNIGIIVKAMAKKTINTNLFSVIWIYTFFIAIVGLIKYRKSKVFLLLLSILVINVVYLLFTYMFVFSSQESQVAASFERYILHFLPVAIAMIAIVYIEFKQEILKADAK